MHRIALVATLLGCGDSHVVPDGAAADGARDAPAIDDATCAALGGQLYYHDEARRMTTVADVTGDGRPDAVVLERATVGDAYRLVVGDGVATFEDADYLVGVLATDVDADGVRDLVVAPPWRSVVYVVKGPIAGVLVPAHRFASPVTMGLANLFGSSVVVVDADGDGARDLVIGAPAEGEEACVAQEPPRVFRGPFDRADYGPDDASFVLDAPAMTCVGQSAACRGDGFELYAQFDACLLYTPPLAAMAAPGACD